MLPFTCGEKKNWYSIKNSQNIMSIIVDLPDQRGGLRLRFLTPEFCSFLPVGPLTSSYGLALPRELED